MNSFEQFSELTSIVTLEGWRDRVYELGNNFGYQNLAMVIFDDNSDTVPAFLQTNYSSIWLDKYVKEKMEQIDPVHVHCLTRSTPLIWSPATFTTKSQKEFYEEACGYGIRVGVSLPVHGPNCSFGLVSFASDTRHNKAFQKHATRHVSELTCLRDFIFESSLRFTKPAALADEGAFSLTTRELECLKWSASGKSSWDIANILNCTESGISSHFSRIREKLGVSTRRQAIVKAIRLALINPA